MASCIKIRPDAKILIVDLAYIGDLLMSTPAYANIRRGFPHAHIDILAAPGSRPVIENNKVFNRIFTTGMKSGGLRAIMEEAHLTETECYDLVVSFHRGHGSLLMLKMARVPLRIGFTNGGRSVFLTHGIPFQINMHRAWNHLALIDECLPIDIDYSIPTHMEPDPVAVASMDLLLNEKAPGAKYIGINPNAAWPTKRWTPEGFAVVADSVSEMGFLPILIGSPKERHVSEQVRSYMKSEPLDLTGVTTLQELAAVFSRCDLVISNDSGPMHIAQAVGTDVLPIFGPTDPERCGPRLGKIEPIQAELDCIKCYRKRCWHLRCMKEIEAGRIIEAVKNYIR